MGRDQASDKKLENRRGLRNEKTSAEFRIKVS